MIITKISNKIKLNQLNYDTIVNHIDLQSITCDQCGHSHWHFHGRYRRTFSFFNHSITIKIIRIFCSHCHKTHAIFLENMIPFSSFLYTDIIRIITSSYSAFVDPSLFYYLKTKYHSVTPLSYTKILSFSARNLSLIILPT